MLSGNRQKASRLLALGALPLTLGACSLILGLEDHEPFPAGAPDAGDAGDEEGGCGIACAGGLSCNQGVCGQVLEIAAGGRNGCAILRDGTVWCWGSNQFGEIGVGTSGDEGCGSPPTPCRPAPTQVPGLSDVVKLAMGSYHTCALKKDQTVWCWGKNATGELGYPIFDPTCICSRTPQQVNLPVPTAQIAAGASSTCARGTDKSLRCWGDNTYGQLGNGMAGAASPNPALVPAFGNDVLDVSVSHTSGEHVCAVREDTKVWCWGKNLYGALGHPSMTDSICINLPCNPNPTPVMLTPMVDFTGAERVTTGRASNCAQASNGTFHCWGYNGWAVLGIGAADTVEHPAATKSGAASGLVTLDLRYDTACGLDGKGLISCWGSNRYGEIGDGVPLMGGTCDAIELCEPMAKPLSSLGVVKQIAAGVTFTVALMQDGTVWTWGTNLEGRLGHAPSSMGDLTDCGVNKNIVCNPTPTQVMDLPP